MSDQRLNALLGSATPVGTGLPRFLLDGGPQLTALVSMFIDDKERDSSAWPQVRRSFLDEVLQIA
ncbi:hypothetical protein [Nocardia sp. NPDC049707]|uniref:hypothetical protein n=1 Tax=Nocardia sp. NPDC049707 TaxID=3154735 RepID=UPI00343560FE